jgi:glycosyltransferase involved in cell wall biosynthesis
VTDQAYKFLFSQGHLFQKFLILLTGYTRRVLQLFAVNHYDFVFIHREAAPIGPPVFEWVIAKILKKKIIYDFDDAIWLTDRRDEGWIIRTIRWRSKVAKVCSMSYKVSCGNRYLCDFARSFNTRVVLNPTTIESFVSEKITGESRITIGWTGSHSTLKYLAELEPVLLQIEHEFDNVDFLIIADRKSNLKLSRLTFLPWSWETEVADLQRIDIGVMPLPDDEWTRGKCGFKILQYMALSIPAIASPVGVNSEIIKHQENGFLCNSGQDWYDALVLLIKNVQLRDLIGKKGHDFVYKNFSTLSNLENFSSLFR